MFDITLAWLQLSRDKTRLLTALAGIAFAVVLIFMQLGFYAALYDSASGFHQNLKADLVLLSAHSKSLNYIGNFSWRRLYQTLSFDGVNSISPIYVGFADWKNPDNGSFRAIHVFGFDPATSVFKFPEVAQNLDKLKLKGNILFDRASRLIYGNIATEFKQGKTIITELGGKRVKVVGLFTLGPSFGADGNIIMSNLNFIRLFPAHKLGEIQIGLIQLKPHVDAQNILKNIESSLPKDIRVLTRQGFVDFEKDYWKTSTPIGFIFSLGLVMGFFVGTIIVYQVLYTDVSDHLSEYATLKAIGYKNSYLEFIVFQEAIILSILGYIPGFIISSMLYDFAKNATFLPIGMVVDRALIVLVMTIMMCSISGFIAIGKLRKADPADIF